MKDRRRDAEKKPKSCEKEKRIFSRKGDRNLFLLKDANILKEKRKKERGKEGGIEKWNEGFVAYQNKLEQGREYREKSNMLQKKFNRNCFVPDIRSCPHPFACVIARTNPPPGLNVTDEARDKLRNSPPLPLPHNTYQHEHAPDFFYFGTICMGNEL